MKKLLSALLILCITIPLSYATQFNRMPAGLIKGARLAWVSSTTIKLSVGYGENAGQYWEISGVDTYATTGYELAGLATSTNGMVQYIYIDSANSLFPFVTLTNSASAPTWSDTYMGWYNGDDRCIGAVWIRSDGGMEEFYCSDDSTYNMPVAIILPVGSITTTANVWNLYDYSPYVPVNACEVRTQMSIWGSWTWSTGAIMPEEGTVRWDYGVQNVSVSDWLAFSRYSVRRFKYLAHASSSTGSIQLSVKGYKLDR